jgi:hypothetical protein
VNYKACSTSDMLSTQRMITSTTVVQSEVHTNISRCANISEKESFGNGNGNGKRTEALFCSLATNIYWIINPTRFRFRNSFN